MPWASSLIRALALIAAIGLGAACSSPEDIAAAERGVAHLHELFGTRDFAKIYDEGDPALRQTPREEFVRFAGAISAQYGDIKSSERTAWNWQTGNVIIEDAPFSGTFVIVVYRTEFTSGPATETFTWRVVPSGVALMGWTIVPD